MSHDRYDLVALAGLLLLAAGLGQFSTGLSLAACGGLLLAGGVGGAWLATRQRPGPPAAEQGASAPRPAQG